MLPDQWKHIQRSNQLEDLAAELRDKSPNKISETAGIVIKETNAERQKGGLITGEILDQE